MRQFDDVAGMCGSAAFFESYFEEAVLNRRSTTAPATPRLTGLGIVLP